MEHPNDEKPPVLPYSSPATEDEKPAPATPYHSRVGMGFTGYILATIGWLYMGSQAFRSNEILVGWIVMSLMLLGLTIYLRVRYGFSGLGVGMGVALLLAVLIYGGLFLLAFTLCGSSRGI